jgi:hypothetical protein
VTAPGRSCPLTYRTRPQAFDAPPSLKADTVYVIGGLYGNLYALEQITGLAEREVAAGLPRPVLIFNGDFNWFNAEPAAFAAVNAAVLAHPAIRGNVETELATPSVGAGCGCAYPAWVDHNMVERSNQIMQRLQCVAADAPHLVTQLGALPAQLTVSVAGLRLGILHGDPDSLAGWGLALEQMPPPGETPAHIAAWFEAAKVDLFACSHTCLPFLQDFTVDGRPRLVMNNGAAGMPNFSAGRQGVISRISRLAAPQDTLYGSLLRDVHCDAVPVPCVDAAWRRWFDRTWPQGSAAALSYLERIERGAQHCRADALRVAARADRVESADALPRG